jgi:outer membrane protein TolC
MILTLASLAMVLTIPGVPEDTLRLSALQDAATARDPRAGQYPMQVEAHDLRLRNLQTERLPQMRAHAEGAHQSDVPTLPLGLPGMEIPEAPRTRYQASLVADQLIYDGGVLAGREAVERARHEEVEAELRATLHPLRTEVNETYFSALLLQVQDREVRLYLADLEARLAEVRSHVAAGAALPGDTAAIEAERLRALQSLDGIAASRAAALAVLSDLTGYSIGESDILAVPDLEGVAARAEAAGGPAVLRERPEFARLARTSERLEREAELMATRTRPRIQTFAQAGIGRPGPFQLFEDELNGFWQVGARLEWRPSTWGANQRERELLRIQQQVVQTEVAALAARLEREVQADLHAMDRLARALEMDERVVALREQVERQALRQFEERELTASQYLSARTDVLEARLGLERHRIELERTRARYLTTLGIPLDR